MPQLRALAVLAAVLAVALVFMIVDDVRVRGDLRTVRVIAALATPAPIFTPGGAPGAPNSVATPKPKPTRARALSEDQRRAKAIEFAQGAPQTVLDRNPLIGSRDGWTWSIEKTEGDQYLLCFGDGKKCHHYVVDLAGETVIGIDSDKDAQARWGLTAAK